MGTQQDQPPQPPYGQPPQPQPQWPQQPYQPASAPQPPKKSLRWLWITLSIVGGIVLLSCGSCAFLSMVAKNAANPQGVITNGSSQTQGSTTKNSTNTPAANTTPDTNSAPIAKVGQTITVSDVSCTLVSVHTLNADAYDKPKPGNQFIVVHVKIVNNSSNEQSYNPFDFHVKSGAGNITDEVFTLNYTANNELHYGKLAPGGSVEGDITFQAPIGDHKAELTWQPNYFGNSSDNAWTLGL